MNQDRGGRQGRGRTFYNKSPRSTQNSNNACGNAPPAAGQHPKTEYYFNQQRTSANSGGSSAVSQNHDNNCCRSINICLDLDASNLAFLDELRNFWNSYKKSPPVISKIHQYFAKCDNPYSHTLRLMYNCQEFNNAKSKSLPLFIIEEFKNWCSFNRNRVIHLLDVELKLDAFQIINRQSTLSLTKIVAEVYEFAQEPEIFLDIVKCMINKKQYREACQNAVLLGLQDRFTVQDFLLPLILQDKLFGIDEFLRSSPQHQVELVTFLDCMLEKPSVRDELASYVLMLEVPNIKWDNLRYKPLKKLIARLVKTHKLPSDLTPNLNKKRNEGALLFLINKRYNEQSVDGKIGLESWREMVQEAIGEDDELKRELMTQCYIYGDLNEALRWARFYQLDKSIWPQKVRLLDENPRFVDENPNEDSSQDQNIIHHEDNWDNKDSTVQNSESIEYHKFPLPSSAIQVVDTELSFERFLDTGLLGVDIVGIDCEWKPTFGGQMNELALMQVATRTNVFILDTIKLGNRTPHLWQELGKFLFDNSDILKLGFSFANDIAIIKSSLPQLTFTPKQIGFLDLLSLWRKMNEKHPRVKLPYEVQGGGPSLSTLVNQCLGRPLDKSDQFSNWENRPLRETQIMYAAIDAYCLIECYDVLKSIYENAGLSFEDACYHLMTNEKAAKRPKKPAKKVAKSKEPLEHQQPPSPHLAEVPAKSMRVVCDTSLQGLGKNLRRCGIDTVILENHQDHMECVRYAIDEHRFILTRGPMIFNRLMGNVPLGHCLNIISDNVDEQLKQFIEYYKVQITKDDVFSVCQVCNGKNFVKIPQSTMRALKQTCSSVSTSAATNSTVQRRRYNFNEDMREEDLRGFTSDEDSDCELAGPSLSYVPSSRIGNSASGGATSKTLSTSRNHHDSSTKNWNLHEEDKVNVSTCETLKGVRIQAEVVPSGVLEKYDLFYVCEECGKVYYDGCHYERIMTTRFKDLIAQ